ncbi:hypothetical protein AVEN_266455-1 [Araneus ventricosus]|uniref:Uncharacterized protein n=1 Tax=Araneus ventricosus TaxID=182803 RepID=A0A4Y2FQY0_ARAVE|nr:hypothetical protein AVEN_266455-1 [Araneus ventricosus]
MSTVVINCWIYYKMAQKEKAELSSVKQKYVMSGNISKKKQEISSLPSGENTPKQARQIVAYPLQKIRLDMSSHLPQSMDEKFTSKYRFPGCKSRSRIKCTKYSVVYVC